MTGEQIAAALQQEYARRREDNMRLYEERQQQVCAQCDGLSQLLQARHAAVMQGVRQTLLRTDRGCEDMAQRMAQLNVQIAEKLSDAGLPANALQPVYTCPACRDEGYVYDPSRRMCDCFRQEYNRRLLAESGIGEHSPTFADYDDMLFSPEVDERGVSQRKIAAAIRDVCIAYADSFPQTETPDLLLLGKSGLGKTFLMQCIARRVAQRGYLPRYTSAYRLFEVARKAYMKNEPDLMDDFMQTELLMIDDLGTEPLLNNVTVTQLFNLLNERQMAGRHTVISTNLSMSEMQERYTERITSRLLDATHCRRMTFIGEDIRLKRKRGEGNA